jgi:hypothetical protein
MYGIIGYRSLVLLLAMPALVSVLRRRRALWLQPQHAVFTVVAVVPILSLLDGVANYMPAPMYVLCAGAATTYVQIHGSKRRRSAGREA